MMQVSFEKSGNWIAFLFGFGLGAFGPGLLQQLSDFVLGTAKSYIIEKSKTMGEMASRGITGIALLVILALMIRKLFVLIATIVSGILIGLAVRMILVQYFGVVPDLGITDMIDLGPVTKPVNQTA